MIDFNFGYTGSENFEPETVRFLPINCIGLGTYQL